MDVYVITDEDEYAVREMMEDDDFYTLEDGCPVESDGRCPHGYDSPLVTLGYI